MRAHRPLLPLALIAATAAMLAGCALKSPPGRDELAATSAPNRQVPPAWVAPSEASGEVADRWLATFHDSQLDALAQEALAYNYDLQVAASRVEQAAALQRVAAGTLYPQVSLLGRGGGKMGGDATGLQGVGIFVNWELDLWGRVRAGAAAAQQQYGSAALDAQYARQSIAAQVAKGWFLATEARMQKQLAEDTVKASTQLESLTLERLRVGVGDEYDVSQAQASLNNLRDTVQSLDQSYQQALRSLEILAGRYPGATLAVPDSLGATSAPIPVGMPSNLLERRPDVVAAERRVAAAMYRTEQAKAARLPTISLTATVTSITSELFVLKDRDNPTWSSGASLLAPLFLGGQLQGQVELRTAEQRQALAEYGRTGARAFSEVENALSAVFVLDKREAILNQVVVDNQRGLDLANTRFRVGSIDLRTTLQQNLRLYGAQSTLLRVRSERLVQRVNLYLALGGSFGERSSDIHTSQYKQ
ncbi:MULTISPECIES: efflux transporter outer membrane subunit [unclassified Variovorax]|uniref:efflux transporter outer membrane subunit n=1 Tax=unclassified Variovorax TaxID=663243 RepID=UPI001BD395E9|nr:MULTISPECIES: efflux transporter outer membrane subunit [unclassified Variovorax]